MHIIIEKAIILVGSILCLAALGINEWTLSAWFCPNGMPEHIRMNFRIYDLFLVSIGILFIIFRKKDIAKNLFLLFSSVLVIYVGAELYFRIFDPHPDIRTNHGQLFEKDNILGWRLIPGTCGDYRTWEYQTHVCTNSAGFRDREYPVKRVSGIKRIVVLGDSFTSGFGVHDADIFTEFMEDRLMERTEIMNFGINGFGPVQEYLLLKTRAAKYRPDLVVMVIYLGNDFDDISGFSDWIDGYGRPKVTFIDGEMAILTPHSKVHSPRKREEKCQMPSSHFANFIDKSMNSLKKDKYAIENMPAELRICKTTPDDQISASLKLMGDIIGETNNFCNNNGIRLLIVAAPSIVQVHEDRYWSKIMKTYNIRADDYDLNIPAITLKQICEKQGIALCDLTPRLKNAAARGKSLYYAEDLHWNAEGHRVVAESLSTFIKRNNLLPQ